MPNQLWRLYGLDLPEPVLTHLYRRNYETVIDSPERDASRPRRRSLMSHQPGR
jgi:hypothetical protein